MEELRNRVVEVLDNQEHDFITTLRLEVSYRKEYNENLGEEFAKLGANYEGLFGGKLFARNGVVYEYERQGPKSGNVRRRRPVDPISQHPPFLMTGYVPPPPFFVPHYDGYSLHHHQQRQQQPRLPEAKVSELYETCNAVLQNSDRDEISIDLLEELVEERLQESGKTVPEGKRGLKFYELVERAASSHINGEFRNGRLCRIPAASHPAPISAHSSHGPYNEPPPPYRPPSVLPDKNNLVLYDSDDAEVEDSTTKNTRFSAPGMKKSSGANLTRDFDNLNLRNMTSPERAEQIENRLIDKYLQRQKCTVNGDRKENMIQIEAVKKCYQLWASYITRLPEFLYIVKCWWLKNRTISLHNLSHTFLNRIVDSSGEGKLEWTGFNIAFEDLVLLNILVLAPNSEQNEQGDLLTANRWIQLLNLFYFSDKGITATVFNYLSSKECENGTVSIDYICKKYRRDYKTVCEKISCYPQMMCINYDSRTIRLNDPLPFMLLTDL